MKPVELHNNFKIRLCAPEDKPALYEICIKTADSGNDASELYTDKEALPDFFVGPYLKLEPELAFAVTDGGQEICGYIIGCLDSEKFYRRFENEWLAEIRKKYKQQHEQILQKTSEESERTQAIIKKLFHPDIYLPPLFKEKYPSHLHMNLLPRAQKQGLGTKMLRFMTQALKKNGSKGLHLGTGTKNKYANPFYLKMGMDIVEQNDITTYYGMSF